MWTPPPLAIELTAPDQTLAAALKARFGDTVSPFPRTSDMLTFQVAETRSRTFSAI